MAHRLAAWLEPRAVKAADFITSVSEVQNAEMAARYPELGSHRMAAIPIGGDPEDFAAAQKLMLDQVARYVGFGAVNLSYVGTFMPRSKSLMKILMKGFARFQNKQSHAVKSTRLNFIGTSNQPNDTKLNRIRPLAEAEGVDDAVWEAPERVPYLTALGCLTQSRGLLLVGSDEPHYTASKIYPALMSGRPYLSLFHRNSSAHKILSRAGGGIALAFSSSAELAGLGDRICDALVRLVMSPDSLGRADPAAYAPYEAKAIAAKYAEIFNGLTQFHARRQ